MKLLKRPGRKTAVAATAALALFLTTAPALLGLLLFLLAFLGGYKLGRRAERRKAERAAASAAKAAKPTKARAR